MGNEAAGVLSAPVVPPAETVPTSETPPPAAPPAAPAAEKPWFDTFQDGDLKTWVGKVGLKNPEAAAQKAWHLERLLGADKAGRAVVIPKDGDEKGMAEFFEKAGRPKTPDEYGIKAPEGADDSFLKEALPVLHGLGLTTKQAQGLAEWWNGKAEGSVQNARETAAAGRAELQREWGPQFEERAGFANRAIAHAGVTNEEAAAIEGALGVARAVKIFEKMGRLLLEAPSPSTLQANQQFRMSPEEAVAQIAALRKDPDFARRYTGGDADALDKMGRLFKIAYPS